MAPLGPPGVPGRVWGFPEGHFGGGAGVPRGIFWGVGWGSPRGILGRGLGNWGAGLDRESGLPCGLQEAKRPQPQRSIADTRWRPNPRDTPGGPGGPIIQNPGLAGSVSFASGSRGIR